MRSSSSNNNNSKQQPYDAIAAYDQLAGQFSRLSSQRQNYLDSIDALIANSIPGQPRSILDVGGGDGRRACKIAQAVGTLDVTVVEPSAGMRARSRATACRVEWIPSRAEELDLPGRSFPVLVCLWNTLGHIGPVALRIEALRRCRRLLAAGGRLFLDVSHRYNARHYGLWRTLLRLARDLLLPRSSNGDVVTLWPVHGEIVSAYGHVFTEREVRSLARQAGFEVVRRHIVDYQTGRLQRLSWTGHLLFELRSSEHV